MTFRYRLALVALFLFTSTARVTAPPTPGANGCGPGYRVITDPKDSFLKFVTSSEEQNDQVIGLLKRGDAKLKALGRAENPVIKEANDEVLKDQALVDALENWWRDLWIDELKKDPALWGAICKGTDGQPILYSGYKEVVVPFSESGEALADRWDEAHVKATERYYTEINDYLSRTPDIQAKLKKARDLLRDPRRQHTSSFVRREKDYPMLALATALNREGRGVTPNSVDQVPRPLRDNDTNLAALEVRVKTFKSVRSDLIKELGQAASKVLTPDGGLTVDINAVLRKVPKLNSATYFDTFVERIGARFKGRNINEAWRVLLEQYYTASPEVRAKTLPQIHEILTRDFGPDAVALFDAIPSSGRSQKIDFIRRELMPLGITLSEKQVQLVADFFDAADRFDPPFLKGKRERLDPERAKHGHFGFDIGQQGAENATRLQEHLSRANNLRQALVLAEQSEGVATQTLNALMKLPKEAAIESGLLTADGSYTASGDDGSLAPPKGAADSAAARAKYYRLIVAKAEAEFPKQDVLHRIRGAFNTGRGDSSLVALGTGLEKKVRTSLGKTQNFDNLKRMMMIIEVTNLPGGKKRADLIITPGKTATVPDALLKEARKALDAYLPEGWTAGEVTVNVTPG